MGEHVPSPGMYKAQLDPASVTVKGSNLRSADHFGCRHQLAVPRLVAIVALFDLMWFYGTPSFRVKLASPVRRIVDTDGYGPCLSCLKHVKNVGLRSR